MAKKWKRVSLCPVSMLDGTRSLYLAVQYLQDFVPPVWFLCITSFNHWLLIVNASCNFLIYCSVGTGFKEVIKSFLSCCKRNNNNQETVVQQQTAAVEMSRFEEVMTKPEEPAGDKLLGEKCHVACESNGGIDVSQEVCNSQKDQEIVAATVQGNDKLNVP